MKPAATASKAGRATSRSPFTSHIPAPINDAAHPLYKLPAGYDVDKVHEIAVLVCRYCFDDKLRLPIAAGGKWLDQGIDLFIEDKPVAANHRCTFSKMQVTTPYWRSKNRRGEWRPTKLIILMEHYEDLLRVSGVEAGPPVLDRM